ncbi:flagellar biosynthesis protein FlaG [Grimontia hollisae]|uniref:Flagellar protein FlaG n=1 Tax=Grimontia hollisae TaxID=673 RepID=A0A377HKU3_GRIHO|nr:flagellar protein FlaG [Grimontia hollisae]AMG29902.1 flagellar biosynthesis protein FlaG [Grimontia hollisae]MDF2185566.1 flagellar protein FlaG [Grimontia hollisae]STO43095.1 flagellar protein FlaG [Grimontia hollisae]STO56797.1 flagellar protein FlaG [Grimontia hollisae]STQ74653.1 flagellar protein FlaG [Grimontia hollisae]
MDLSSVSTSSLSHVTPQSGTKIASNQTVERAQPNITNQQQMAENVEKLSQHRVEQVQRLEDTRKIQQEQLEMLVERLDEFVSTFNKGLSFRLDEQSGRSVVTVYEMSSGDIIRQIPEKEMLELAQQLSLHARGLVAEKV